MKRKFKQYGINFVLEQEIEILDTIKVKNINIFTSY